MLCRRGTFLTSDVLTIGDWMLCLVFHIFKVLEKEYFELTDLMVLTFYLCVVLAHLHSCNHSLQQTSRTFCDHPTRRASWPVPGPPSLPGAAQGLPAGLRTGHGSLWTVVSVQTVLRAHLLLSVRPDVASQACLPQALWPQRAPGSPGPPSAVCSAPRTGRGAFLLHLQLAVVCPL